MVNKQLLEDVYSALESFCGDQRWQGTFQGTVLEQLADELKKPSPYLEEENEHLL